MSFLRCLALSALLALPSTVRAQDARLTERLDAATAAQVQQVVDSANKAGLPSEPIARAERWRTVERRALGEDTLLVLDRR